MYRMILLNGTEVLVLPLTILCGTLSRHDHCIIIIKFEEEHPRLRGNHCLPPRYVCPIRGQRYEG